MNVKYDQARTLVLRARRRGLIPPATPLEEYEDDVRQAEDEVYGKADVVEFERARR